MIGFNTVLWVALYAGSIGATENKLPRRVDIYQPNFHQTQRYRDTRSVDKPAVELLMHLPPAFEDVNAFRKFLGFRPERKRREVFDKENHRSKRSAESDMPDSVVVDSPELDVLEESRSGTGSSYLPELSYIQRRPYDDSIIKYAAYSDDLSTETQNDPRKTRRNTSANDHEDGSMKRGSYSDPPNQTTASPFWKQQMPKKSNAPTFVTQTQREGRGQNSYDLSPQHRNNAENARESHMMKDKPTISNEINPLRDSYYSASDPSTRREYNSRQAETSSPKSAYDSIDFTASRRGGAGRNADSRGRLTTDSYTYSRSYSPPPRPYDSRYYYPLPGDIQSRGLEYYHRTIDPGTGRIVYYATLPEPSPNFDGYTGRSLPGRAYTLDAYGRPYPAVPNYPYYPNYPAYPVDYLRSSRISTPAEPYQNIRYDDRYRDDGVRNKTYVIFDVEDDKVRAAGSAGNSRLLPDERTRYRPPVTYPPYAFPPAYNVYNSYPAYQYRNPYYPDVRGVIGGENSFRDAQLSTRSLPSSYDSKPPLKPLKP